MDESFDKTQDKQKSFDTTQNKSFDLAQDKQREVNQKAQVPLLSPPSHKKLIIGIVAMVVLVVAGTLGAYFVIQKSDTGPVACTAEAKICPDGSSVGRTGPNCEFAECAVEITTRESVSDGWQTYFIPYDYEGTGFEVALPQYWVEDNSGTRAGLKVFALKNNIIWFNLGHGHRWDLESVVSTTTINGKNFKLIEFAYPEDWIIDGELYRGKGLHEKSIDLGKGILAEIYSISAAPLSEDLVEEFDQILSTFKFIEPQVSIDTSEWKTYRNEEYGFEFSYLPGWKITEKENEVKLQNIGGENNVGPEYESLPIGETTVRVQESLQDLEQETCLPKPIPQKVTSAYFESISEKTDSNCKLFFTYLGTIDIDGNIGYQFIHREYFTVKWTLMERNDGSWIAVSGFLEHQPTTLVETSLEPYDSVISTFKFIE